MLIVGAGAPTAKNDGAQRPDHRLRAPRLLASRVRRAPASPPGSHRSMRDPRARGVPPCAERRRRPSPPASRDETTMAAKAAGTETSAGCASSAPKAPPGFPTTRSAAIAAVAITDPASIPTAAPRAVRPLHQMPSTSSGQNVLAANANAQPTSTPISMWRTGATTRRNDDGPERRTVEAAPASPGGRVGSPQVGQTSYEIVPASETRRPDDVERKAAKAPAAVIPLSSSPPSPGHASEDRARPRCRCRP